MDAGVFGVLFDVAGGSCVRADGPIPETNAIGDCSDMSADISAWIETRDRLVEQLLAFRTEGGYWTGRLSSSALATATAVFALAMADPDRYDAIIHAGLDWLRDHQNPDGGWGDTPQNASHPSTTLLAWSALAVARHPSLYEPTSRTAEAWLRRRIGSLETLSIIKAVGDLYGSDRTFAVPILSMCALAGRIGRGPDVWRRIPPLPFELAALPRGLFRFLRLSVVSYALPALIAIGRLRHSQAPPRNPLTRGLRRLVGGRVMRILERIQPPNGGFLEAVPLTAFVTMSLIESGCRDHPAVRRGVDFLLASVRTDGAWPIDSDLAVWVTTLSVRALGTVPSPDAAESDALIPNLPADRDVRGADRFEPLGPHDRRNLIDWLVGRQFRGIHPYTGAAPGGWGWTDKPGAVPDADDTAGALVALYHLGAAPDGDRRLRSAVRGGLHWLLDLQNRDGGIPTFCRGWNRLDFDRSAADLTAHALAAWGCWINECPRLLQRRIGRAMEHAIAWLDEHQRSDGAWLPLWFGNENTTDQSNPVYGTARVLGHLSLMPREFVEPNIAMFRRGGQWLLDAQNDDGGWGGDAQTPSTIEETALALEALATTRLLLNDEAIGLDVLARAADWLAEHTRRGTEHAPSPIGLYFAKLWYAERLYPIIFAAGALTRTISLFRKRTDARDLIHDPESPAPGPSA